MITYKGYNLSYDPKFDEEMLKSDFSEICNVVEELVSAAKDKLTELETFANNAPKVAYNVPSINLDTVLSNVKTAVDNSVATVCSVIESIKDYSDGKWDNDANKANLDEFIKNNLPPAYYPPSGDSPDKQGDLDPDLDGEDLEVPETITPTGDVAGDDSDYTPDADNSIYQGSIYSSAGEDNTGVVDDTDESKSLEVDDSNNLSFFGSSGALSVPSITSGSIKGVKSSGMLGVAGVVAAAGTATILGKSVYDKKQEEASDDGDDDDNLEEDDDDKSTLDNTSVIEFKKELIERGEVER